jgi:hypothetical protein
LEINGKIKVIEQTKEYGAKGFKKRGFVIVTDDKYPQTVPLEFTQDKVTILDKYKVGDDVKVSFNVNGREWTSPQGEVKYFVSLGAWRIEKEGETQELNPDPDGLPF